MVAARELLDHAHGDAFIGDTGYDSNDLRAEIKARHQGGHPLEARAQARATARPHALPDPLPRRGLLPRAEAIFELSARATTRPSKLRRTASSRVHLPMALLTRGRSRGRGRSRRWSTTTTTGTPLVHLDDLLGPALRIECRPLLRHLGQRGGALLLVAHEHAPSARSFASREPSPHGFTIDRPRAYRACSHSSMRASSRRAPGPAAGDSSSKSLIAGARVQRADPRTIA
jgi:hypothetical protein